VNKKNLFIYERPKLNRPYLVIAFEGWPDAGRVASGAVTYLRDKLGARQMAEVEPDDFYLFQTPSGELLRPTVEIKNGGTGSLKFPATGFWFYKGESSPHDLILVLGREPELRWRNYTNLVLGFAREYRVERIYALGGTFDIVPHSIEPLVGAVLGAPELSAEVAQQGIQLINYRGPSSIHSAILLEAGRWGIPALALWGYVPHYVQVPNARVCHAVLRQLTKMIGLEIDLAPLERDGRHLTETIDRAVAEKSELAEYVKRLETEYGRGREVPAEPLKEDVIKEIEDFLKQGGEGKEPS
jgi:proteasome assembly chaperone (PAC2) family protein